MKYKMIKSIMQVLFVGERRDYIAAKGIHAIDIARSTARIIEPISY